MKVINLSEGFNPFNVPDRDTIKFQAMKFHGGEPHVKIHEFWNSTEYLDIGLTVSAVETVMIATRINSFGDFGLFAVTVDALRRMGVERIHAFIPYFPGARQDRVTEPGEPLTVSVYANLINSMGLSQVFIYDPHSDVTPAVLNNCVVLNNHRFIRKVAIEILSDDVGFFVVSPDAGSNKKIEAVYRNLPQGAMGLVHGNKKRDTKTGELTGFEVYADNLYNQPCLIIDDICDGGGTFLGLGEKLKEKGAGDLYLAVSHGIFSKGFSDLNRMFKQVFTTNSIDDWHDTALRTYNFYNALPARLTAFPMEKVLNFDKHNHWEQYQRGLLHAQDIDM